MASYSTFQTTVDPSDDEFHVSTNGIILNDRESDVTNRSSRQTRLPDYFSRDEASLNNRRHVQAPSLNASIIEIADTDDEDDEQAKREEQMRKDALLAQRLQDEEDEKAARMQNGMSSSIESLPSKEPVNRSSRTFSTRSTRAPSQSNISAPSLPLSTQSLTNGISDAYGMPLEYQEELLNMLMGRDDFDQINDEDLLLSIGNHHRPLTANRQNASSLSSLFQPSNTLNDRSNMAARPRQNLVRNRLNPISQVLARQVDVNFDSNDYEMLLRLDDAVSKKTGITSQEKKFVDYVRL